GWRFACGPSSAATTSSHTPRLNNSDFLPSGDLRSQYSFFTASWLGSLARSCRGAGCAPDSRLCRTRSAGDGKRFNIDDQLQQPFLADLALESGHHVRLEAGNYFCVGIQNRFADISVVGHHGLAILKLHV